MKAIAMSASSLWWLPVIAAVVGLLIWQRRRLRLSPLSGAAFGLLLLALLNPLIMLQPQATDRVEYNLQLTKPKVLLVEYGGGKTYLGTVLGKDSPVIMDIVSPDDLPMLADTMRRYDVVALHASKNLQVYTSFLSDWHSFPNRSKLESVFSDYGVVFDNGTQNLPEQLDNYGLIVLAGADIKPEDTDRLLDYVNKGGRLLVMLHAAGGLGVNPPGTINPYCILYHHPPYGDRPFPEEWLQRNTASMLTARLGIRSMENITCTYGNMVVQKSDLTVLHNIYAENGLFPDKKIDGKEFDKLVWTTAFVDYDSSWQPLLRADNRYTNEPAGHGTPVPISIQGKAVALARQYGKGSVYLFGYCSMNYGTSGVPPSMFLTAAPYIGSDLTYNEQTTRALANYVTQGGNLVVIGPSIPKSSGKAQLADLLPVNVRGPQVSEFNKVVFRNSKHPVLNGIPPFFVSHYRVTAIKANGEAVAVDGKNNPVIATSYYGLGRVVYYLPEIPVQASVDNTAVPDFWRKLILWLSPADAGAPGRNDNLAVYNGGRVPLYLRISDDRGAPVEKAEVSGEYVSPDGITGNSRLKETSAGTYAADLSLPETGDYRLSFYVRSGTVMKTSPVDLLVKSSSLGETERKIRQGLNFLDGYHSQAPLLVELPVWQLLAGAGVILLCIDWSIKILRREI